MFAEAHLLLVLTLLLSLLRCLKISIFQGEITAMYVGNPGGGVRCFGWVNPPQRSETGTGCDSLHTFLKAGEGTCLLGACLCNSTKEISIETNLKLNTVMNVLFQKKNRTRLVN